MPRGLEGAPNAWVKGARITRRPARAESVRDGNADVPLSPVACTAGTGLGPVPRYES